MSLEPGFSKKLRVPEIAAFVVVYWLTARMAVSLRLEGTVTSPVWPPTGLALAVVLTFGYRFIIGVGLGNLLVMLQVYLQEGQAGSEILPLVGSITFASCMEAFIGAYLVRRMTGKRFPFDRSRDVVRFVLGGAMIAPLSSAVLGLGGEWLTGTISLDQAGHLGTTWWIANMGGALVFAPFLMAWFRAGRIQWDPRRWAEAGGVFVLLVLICWTVFVGAGRAAPGEGHPLTFLSIPVVVWAALRFRHRGATTATLLATSFAVWGTMKGLGPFAKPSPHESALLLQIYSGTVALTALLLAAVQSERRGAERVLRERESRLGRILEGMPVMLDAFDARGNIVLWNRECQRVTGYRSDEVVGHPAAMEMLYPNAAYRERMLRELGERQGPYRNWEWTLTCKSGQHRTIAWSSMGEEFPIRGWWRWGIGFDVTERKQAELELAAYRNHLEEIIEERTRQLAESREQLRKAERLASIGTLAAGLAHEINNPVGGILLAAQNALELNARNSDADLMRTCLRDIVDNSERCTQIVRSVLQFSRQKPTEKRPVAPGPLLEQAVRRMQVYATENRGTIELQLGPDLPRIMANSLAIEQSLINLLRNAVEAGVGGVSIQVRGERAERDLRISVSDNGRGIPEDQLQYIFDPFFTTRREQGGTGLGLSIVHGIIEEHGGTIEVRSELGRGTVFAIELPAFPGAGTRSNAAHADH